MTIKQAKKQKAVELPEEVSSFEDLDFGLQKGPEEHKIEFPGSLEDFDIESELKQKSKPKEILEAEDEIQNAIEKIKKWDGGEREERERASSRAQLTSSKFPEKPSILKRLFSKKVKEEAPEKHIMLELPVIDDVSRIQSKISEARQALMKFDLETAKRDYIEIMKKYNNLKPVEQAKVYHDIKDLYFERKSAEELKV